MKNVANHDVDDKYVEWEFGEIQVKAGCSLSISASIYKEMIKTSEF